MFNIGDELPYTINGITYHAVIVAFDSDEDRNGNKIPITFITKELYILESVMQTNINYSNYQWKGSYIRKTILPQIIPILPSRIASSLVAAKKLSSIEGSA